MPNARYLIVPGLGNSEPGHWQSLWQEDLKHSLRVEQTDWESPERQTWLESLSSSVAANPGAVLIAHSLGCALIAHAVAQFPSLPIAGALLVAPADVNALQLTATKFQSFAPLPMRPLPFASIVVASSNDPYVRTDRARRFAEDWGSRFVDIGPCGHINIAAGFGAWPEGRRLLAQLCELPRSRKSQFDIEIGQPIDALDLDGI